ncbi:ANTAR domain-containing response regulator [Bacillus massilinigeriensis]|uniref:ANTAR domain-containing response regulator n=1 Tax=Bacillus massilionigeriensis TaxID=1805475 RepID=UPI000A04016E|nr:response regulator [Bacillus massilionigeriensis]
MMNYRIMIVDDDPIIRMDLREMLKEEGCEIVKECRNGEEAVEQCIKLNPDLVLMDIKMPVLNGLKASKIIQEKCNTAILLLTAYSQRELIEKAKDSGVTAYLVKPVTEADLFPAIEMAMNQKRKFDSLTEDIRSLKKKMEERRIIEKAKGKVMAKKKLSEEEAYQWLREQSMKKRISLKSLSEQILKKQSNT